VPGIERRYPPAPLVGVAGVVMEGKRILLIRRGKSPGKGQWNLPGGLVEVGESLKEAVAREVEEETGLKVSVGDLVAVGDRIIRDAEGRVAYHYVLLDYLCRVEGGTLAPGTDASDARWVTADQLRKVPLSKPVRRIIEKAMAGVIEPVETMRNGE